MTNSDTLILNKNIATSRYTLKRNTHNQHFNRCCLNVLFFRGESTVISWNTLYHYMYVSDCIRIFDIIRTEPMNRNYMFDIIRPETMNRTYMINIRCSHSHIRMLYHAFM